MPHIMFEHQDVFAAFNGKLPLKAKIGLIAAPQSQAGTIMRVSGTHQGVFS